MVRLRLRDGRHESGAKALITQPGTASVREMVQVAVDALGIDLSKELPTETREAIARRAGVSVNQTKSPIEWLRRTRGLGTRTQRNPADRPKTQPAKAPKTEVAVEPVSEPTIPSPGPQALARTLAVELAGELLPASRETDGERRGELLLLAGSLLNRVL